MTETPVNYELDRASKQGRWIALVVVVVLAAFVLVLATRPSPESRAAAGATSPIVGTPSPVVQGVALDGRAIDFSTLRGHWIVVNFFATWCQPCIEEHPELVAFADKYNASRASTAEAAGPTATPVIVVSMAYQDPRGNVEKFFRDHGGSWPVLPDDNGTLAVAFGARGLPETFFVNPAGIVDSHISGGVTVSDLAKRTQRSS